MFQEQSKKNKSRREITRIGKWSNDQQGLFQEALDYYGKNWRKVQEYIKTRSLRQVRSHAQKYFIMSKKVQIINDKIKQTKTIKQKVEKPEISEERMTHFRKDIQTNEDNQNNQFYKAPFVEPKLVNNIAQKRCDEISSNQNNIFNVSNKDWTHDIEGNNTYLNTQIEFKPNLFIHPRIISFIPFIPFLLLPT